VSREDLELRRRAWEHAWRVAISNTGGKSGSLAPFVGSLAWGRYEYECRPSEHKEDVARGVGYLEGMRVALLNVARKNELPFAEQLTRMWQDVTAHEHTARRHA